MFDSLAGKLEIDVQKCRQLPTTSSQTGCYASLHTVEVGPTERPKDCVTHHTTNAWELSLAWHTLALFFPCSTFSILFFMLSEVSTRKKKMVPFISLSVLFVLLQCPLPTLSTNSEGNALNALKIQLIDPNNVLQSWDSTLVNPCTWFHVTCDSNNHVTRLDLGNANISGTLGPELGQLKHLQYLELYKNDLSGKIPKQFGKLKKLVSMDLYDNKFEGKIPKSFGNLKSLRFLRLNNNNLTGSIPRELTHLNNLNIFDVSNNDLCGTIPVDGPSFATFPPESFENNRFNGPELKGIPYDFGC
ncbi:hypothetical protein L6164_035757 [Bauhinia variegata]|uniref:Uncharacterized protein n=1 Tax=Bauhinia variegata TaxID=167791 RepID=A0ACB9KF27_BAUVA|nr:hypothetical protein L6164_035757 [Bauhinia variegata]